MKIVENFINQGPPRKLWDWGQHKCDLKGEYKSEHAGEVKTYKLSKKELKEYLKKFK